jgi:hypothetical protein
MKRKTVSSDKAKAATLEAKPSKKPASGTRKKQNKQLKGKRGGVLGQCDVPLQYIILGVLVIFLVLPVSIAFLVVDESLFVENERVHHDNHPEWALRVVESAALAIHSILDITDPFIGAKSSVLRVEDSLPGWFLPAIGILRAAAAVANFSENPHMVLGAQAYISALWSGAVYFHLRRKHHPTSALPASMFVVLAAAVTAMRVNFWVALAGTLGCAVIAVGLGRIFVKPAPAALLLDAKKKEKET